MQAGVQPKVPALSSWQGFFPPSLLYKRNVHHHTWRHITGSTNHFLSPFPLLHFTHLSLRGELQENVCMQYTCYMFMNVRLLTQRCRNLYSACNIHTCTCKHVAGIANQCLNEKFLYHNCSWEAFKEIEKYVCDQWHCTGQINRSQNL